MNSDYLPSDLFGALRTDQLSRLSHDEIIRQLDRVEEFLRNIERDRRYEYAFIVEQITGFPRKPVPVEIIGSELTVFLRQYIEEMSASAKIMPKDYVEPVHTVAQVARTFSVSPDEIAVWRNNGLVTRIILFPDGRQRTAFLHSSLEYFLERDRPQLYDGVTLRDIEILGSARRLKSQTGGCLAEIAVDVAVYMQMNVYQVRSVIEQFDSDNPDLAVFKNQDDNDNESVSPILSVDLVIPNGVDREELKSIAARVVSTINQVFSSEGAEGVQIEGMELFEFAEVEV